MVELLAVAFVAVALAELVDELSESVVELDLVYSEEAVSVTVELVSEVLVDSESSAVLSVELEVVVVS